MGIISDIAADGDRCLNCGRLLHKHYGGHELYEILRMYDDDIVDALAVDVRCSTCGYTNEIFLQAWLPTTANMRDLMAMEWRRKMRVIDGRRDMLML
ncbi:MAG: hypothetical protein ACE5PV_24335 [Candidatus Poribacteria bacterium]